MKRLLFLVPIALFAGLLYALPRQQPAEPDEASGPVQVGRPAPAFRLARLDRPDDTFTPAAMRGQVWLLNVWASWCKPCREELPTLQGLSSQVAIVGLNYRDPRDKGLGWLKQFGNPYKLTAHDVEGQAGSRWGIFGVPETFVIDKRGVVRLRLSGPVTPQVVQRQLLPLIGELNRG